jgi:hypothetical protein
MTNMKSYVRVLVSLTAVLAFAIAADSSAYVSAQPAQVEVFDVKLGRTVKQFTNTPEIRQEAERLIGSITGVVTNVNPEPKEGIIVGIPLIPPLQVKNSWVQDTAVILFVFINRATVDRPVLLLINDDNQPLLFQARVDLTPFLEKYDLRQLLEGPF